MLDLCVKIELMKALYRKYRPVKMAEVIGQEQVTQPLENALKSGKISHAYIFIGPRGCGKTSVARIFAHEINKFPYEIEDDYTDIIEIDAASNTGVDNIRELREKAIVAPTKGKYKVYIIDEVHMLSKSAFNALLKTLEEPPKHVVFIMATTDAYKIPATITSRAQVFNFNLATPDVMHKHLLAIANKEKIDITPEALEVVVSRGGGSFRDSLSLLDQIATLKTGKISEKDVISALGLPEDAKVEQLLSAYKQEDANAITEALKEVLDSGITPEVLAEDLIDAIIKHPEPETLPLLQKLPEVSFPFPEAKLLLAFLENYAVKPVITTPISPVKTEKTTSSTPNSPVSPVKPPVGDQASNVGNTAVPVEKPSEGVSEARTPNKPAPGSATTPVEPTPKQTMTPVKLTPIDFNWEGFLEAVRDKNSTISGSLKRAKWQATGKALTLYFARPFDRKVIEAPNNIKLLKSALEGLSLGELMIEITDDKSKIAENSAKDPQTEQISAIMGEVQEVKDGDPFGE